MEALILFIFFQFYSVVIRDSKVDNFAILLLLFSFTLLRVFHTSIIWLFSTGVWVTVSLLKSAGLFLVFWQIITMLQFGWFPLILLFPSPLVPIPIFWWLYQLHQLQLVITITIIIIIIIIIIIYSLEFSHQHKLMVFHWRLSDSKSPQVSRILFSILAVFNNAVVWMVSTRSPTSKSSRPFNNPLVTMPKAPITISIIVTFMFHSFFNSLARSRYLSLFSHSFSFILWRNHDLWL